MSINGGERVKSATLDVATIHRLRADSQRPLTWALRDAGFQVDSVWDFVNGPTPPSAIPLLLKHIERDYMFSIKEGIARSLTIKDAPPEVRKALVTQLVSLRDRQGDFELSAYKRALGFAIAYLSKKQDFDELVGLALDRSYGDARRPIIKALPRKNRSRAGDILLQLVEQPDVMTAVIDALAYLRDPRAKEIVEALVMKMPSKDRSKGSFQSVARNYLTKIA